MLNTLKDLSTISLLFLVFIYIYQLIGMELFAYKLHGIDQESTFNSFIESFISVFIVLANDGWTKIYLAHYQVANPISTTLFFITLLSIGQFLLLNLLIAIIIENFEYLSVKSDLIKKIDNMNNDEET